MNEQIENSNLTDHIYIYSQKDAFILTKGGVSVLLEKTQKSIAKLTPYDEIYSTDGEDILGIIGLIEGKENIYLLAIKKSVHVGKLFGNNIYKIEEIKFFKYFDINSFEDNLYNKMIQDFIFHQSLYYSPSIDLTLSFYSRVQNTNNLIFSEIFRGSDQRFLWNYTNSVIFNSLMRNFIFPIINGFIKIIDVEEDYEKPFSYGIISRKDYRRNGYRFIVNGNDLHGNCSHFIETEQFIIVKNDSEEDNLYSVTSYVQLNGSIPLIWNQNPNLSLFPPIVPLDENKILLDSYNKHILDISYKYGHINIVNLISKEGDNKILGEFYKSLHFINLHHLNKNTNLNDQEIFKESPNKIEFTWIDFDKQLSKNFDNVNNLFKIDEIKTALGLHEFTQLQIKTQSIENNLFQLKTKILNKQKGFFRMNYINGLEQTNLIQFIFARQFLHKMMYRLNICKISDGNRLENFHHYFENIFRNLWVQNGDLLSIAYCGTSSLKRELITIGKGTLKGYIQDYILICKRFYLNNCCDGYNQDCHDLFIGVLNPKKKSLKGHSTFLVKTFVILILLTTLLLYRVVVSFCLKSDHIENWKISLFKILIFLGMFIICSKILMNGLKKTIVDNSTIKYSI